MPPDAQATYVVRRHTIFATRMPELPEVETTRLSFVDRIRGARITDVRMGKPLRWPLGHPTDDLISLTVTDVQRRSKYLILVLQNQQGTRSDEANQTSWLIIHLGMSGSLRFEEGNANTESEHKESTQPHEHFTMRTTRGVLRLIDPRRFGAVVYAPQGARDTAAQKLLSHLGPEPLSAEFTPRYLYQALRNRRIPIKQAIMDAKVVVGVGNIYASESLFHARIHPTTAAHKLGHIRCARLHAAITKVLQAALAAGGSSLRNYASADGEPGYFQLATCVYARDGQACRNCGTTVQMLRLGQRSTFFCPSCQRK